MFNNFTAKIFRTATQTLPLAALLTLSTPAIYAQAADTSTWTNVSTNKNIKLLVKPGTDLASYAKFEVKPISVNPSASSKRPLKPAEAAKLSSAFETSLKKNFGDSAIPAGEAGLILEPTITAVKRSNGILNFITAAAIFVPVDMGGASSRVVLKDAQTGEQVGEIESKGRGKVWQVLPSFQSLGQSRLVLKEKPKAMRKAIQLAKAPVTKSGADSF